jgi:cyclic pyranopterin phosphate synthase
MPGEGVPLKPREEILSYEQIEAISREAAGLGITKVRLTGGEPLIRRDIQRLVAQLARIEGIEDLAMTTNGTRLGAMAAALKENGLHRVNISLDSLDPDRYRRTTRGGDIARVLEGIDAAVSAGLSPVKINMVLMQDTTGGEIARMRHFCREKGLLLQTIDHFRLRDRSERSTQLPVDRPPACRDCNRLRLTADGYFKPCLFSEAEIRVDLGNVRASILEAVARKPANGSHCRNRAMCQVGG